MKYDMVCISIIFLLLVFCQNLEELRLVLVKQEVASRMGFPGGSVRQYGTDQDLKSFLVMVDIVLYWSYNAEQCFPPPLLLAMSFEIPVVAPNLSVIEKYVSSLLNLLFFF